MDAAKQRRTLTFKKTRSRGDGDVAQLPGDSVASHMSIHEHNEISPTLWKKESEKEKEINFCSFNVSDYNSQYSVHFMLE